ncbi:hypothetical protein GHT06_011248 [Daphnia sinensis]|uniref:Uncharacterized protein n=1 Tax=Daphnia sinensis TaxID=1820382 RepID=A0AAD5LK45_9CRUS|nr:hypothetical protein GHT06_011248 [Daphnia sinensis]
MEESSELLSAFIVIYSRPHVTQPITSSESEELEDHKLSKISTASKNMSSGVNSHEIAKRRQVTKLIERDRAYLPLMSCAIDGIGLCRHGFVSKQRY